MSLAIFKPVYPVELVPTRRPTVYRGGTVRKLLTYFEVPAFDLANTWRGSSEIIKTYDFDFDFNLSINEVFPIIPPTGTTALLTIMWRGPGVDEITRYKLWEDIGEILYLPLYGGQRIGKPFSIEVWNTLSHISYLLNTDGEPILNTDGQPIIVSGSFSPRNAILPEPLRLYTSKLILPSGYCEEDDIALAEPTECVDPIFYLEDFQPLFGDYYIFVAPCQRLLVKGGILVPDVGYNILKSTDDSWHLVYFVQFGDQIYHHVEQTNTVPPPDALGYFPLIVLGDGQVRKLALEAVGEAPFSHQLDIQEEITPDESWNAVSLPSDFDGNRYAMYLQVSGSDIQIKFYLSPL